MLKELKIHTDMGSGTQRTNEHDMILAAKEVKKIEQEKIKAEWRRDAVHRVSNKEDIEPVYTKLFKDKKVGHIKGFATAKSKTMYTGDNPTFAKQADAFVHWCDQFEVLVFDGDDLIPAVFDGNGDLIEGDFTALILHVLKKVPHIEVVAFKFGYEMTHLLNSWFENAQVLPYHDRFKVVQVNPEFVEVTEGEWGSESKENLDRAKQLLWDALALSKDTPADKIETQRMHHSLITKNLKTELKTNLHNMSPGDGYKVLGPVALAITRSKNIFCAGAGGTPLTEIELMNWFTKTNVLTIDVLPIWRKTPGEEATMSDLVKLATEPSARYQILAEGDADYSEPVTKSLRKHLKIVQDRGILMQEVSVELPVLEQM